MRFCAIGAALLIASAPALGDSRSAERALDGPPPAMVKMPPAKLPSTGRVVVWFVSYPEMLKRCASARDPDPVGCTRFGEIIAVDPRYPRFRLIYADFFTHELGFHVNGHLKHTRK